MADGPLHDQGGRSPPRGSPQRLSRGPQLLAAELSGRWIVATGDPQQTESAGDSFGFALRVDEVNLGVLRAVLFPAPPK